MLRYRLINFENDDDLDLLVKWYCDRKIRHLSFRHRNSESYDNIIDRNSVREKLLKKPQSRYRMYLITWEGIPIGEMSIELASTAIKFHRKRSCWIGIIIGESHARGKGLGGRILKKLEQVARDMGASRIELGVFEFNLRALQLYRNAGYQVCLFEKNSTWWKGKMHGSLRMEKNL
ncbi:MAG: GNAT family N-acetyltransferase [Proteobacteria bacterium]|nr:GNAT family N-acetyltransferase [Pseudomonadota bacterium]